MDSARIAALTAGKRYQDINIYGRAHLGDVFHFGPGDLLSRLPYAGDAAFNSYNKQYEPTCLKNTRDDVLKEIYTWAERADDCFIYWLSGLAGTGKSTIARTVARSRFDKGNLGASFFFSRGGGDTGHAGKFVTTIAVQLASNVPPLQQHIRNVFAERTEITSQSLRDQWQQLVLLPLSKLKDRKWKCIVLVVDALDECDDERNILIILQLLAEARLTKTVRLRILLTSRPGNRIRHGFSQMLSSQHKDLELHHISPRVIDHDITIYLEHELQIIRQEYDLHGDWPGQESIRSLVQRAAGLFIWAATACRFIHEGGEFAERRLSNILQSGSSVVAPERHLNTIYFTVLQNASSHTFNDDEKEEYLTRLRKVIGYIILLLSPLSVNSISKLLGVSNRQVNQTLHRLHAILDIPENATRPLRLYHPSFRDFLLDRERCNDPNFWINEKEAQQSLAISCIQLMSTSLKQDICELGSPGFLVSDINDGQVNKYLPLELQYACLYWIQHLQKSYTQLDDHGTVHQFLQSHFLHWIEALSWIQKIPEALRMISTLESIALGRNCPDLQMFIHDMKRFVLFCRPGIEQTPLQLYYSVLIFVPTQSIVKRQFDHLVPSWIHRSSNVENDWSMLLRTLSTHQSSYDNVSDAKFSADGKLLASISGSTIYIWNPGTGNCLHTLEGHRKTVQAIVFSRDNHLLASVSSDRTAVIWDTSTGNALHTLHGHTSYVYGVSFSPDGKLIASASWDRTIRIWSSSSGAGLHTILSGHDGYPSVVVFSPNGKLLALPSLKTSIMLWDVITERTFYTLTGHSSSVTCIAFSTDSKLVVSGSTDKTVKLWDTSTGAWLFSFQHPSSDLCTVAFSPNDKFLASNSGYGRITLCDVESRKTLFTMPGGSYRNLAFSPDSKLLASASYSGINLWDTDTGLERRVLESGDASAVAFSPDGELLATASQTGNVKLWDIGLVTRTYPLHGHTGRATAVGFSFDGNLLASGSIDATVQLFDFSTRVMLKLRGHSKSVTALIFSSHNTLLASASDDGTVVLWNCNTGTALHQLCHLATGVDAITFSPDDRLLASASGSGVLRVWDTGSGTTFCVFKGHSYGITTMVFSPDGKVLASASYDKTVVLWNVETGTVLHQILNQPAPIRVLAFSPDGQLLSFASHQNIVQTWDAITGAQLNMLEDTKSLAPVILSPNGKLAASKLDDHTIKVWDASTGMTIRMLQVDSPLKSTITFSRDCKLLAAVSDEKTVKLWNISNEEGPYTLPIGSDSFEVFTFSPDSKLLALGLQSGTIKVWDTSTAALLHIIQGSSDPWMGDRSSSGGVVTISPNGKLLASSSNPSRRRRWPGGLGDTVKLWDSKTEEELHKFSTTNGNLTALAFSPDSGRLAVGSYKGVIELWDTVTGDVIHTLKDHKNSVWEVTFSPNGDLLASVSWDNSDTMIGSPTLILWNSITGVVLHTFEGTTAHMKSITFSADSRLLALDSLSDIALWDVNDGKVFKKLKSNGARSPRILAFSPESKWLASGSYSGFFEIWDVERGAQLRKIQAHQHNISALAFSAQGMLLASASDDKTIKIWLAAKGTMLEKIEIGISIHKMSFSSDGTFLETERGVLQTISSSNNAAGYSESPRSIFVKGEWITRDRENLLWLPSNYHSKCIAVHSSMVAISYKPHRIFYLKFSN
ncbi:WD40-repeat-containing domain protein [Bisporella sp. PMI_857]|nr:WD40-repeat-containing domain protein [Bisporella sp. PMI_857]